MACCICSAWITSVPPPRQGAWRRSKSASWPGSASPIPMNRAGPPMAEGGSRVRRTGGVRGWLRRLRGEPEVPTSLRDELEELIEEHEAEAPIDPEERALLTNSLRLHDITAADI